VDLATLPATHGRHNPGGATKWWRRMQRTCAYLASRGRTTLYFDTHLFQPHSASAFERIVAEAPYEEDLGFCVNTLVLNSIPDLASRPSGQVRGRLMRGYDDAALSKGLKEALAAQFPRPSRFEAAGPPRAAPRSPLATQAAAGAPPRVFTFWTGPQPPIIKLCLDSMRRNIPGIEVWTLEQWEAAYDGKFGPWERIVGRRPNVQSDLLRYWLLSTHGGIWLDADYIAFRDIRPVWDGQADYVGYPERSQREMPFTALMGGHPASPIVQRQCALAKEILEKRRIGRAAGPLLTLQALRACPQANVVRIAKDLIHPIVWHRSLARPDSLARFAFHDQAYGLMLVGLAIDRYRALSEDQLMADPSAIGRAFRKAFSSSPSTETETERKEK
jgi:hypothetical protein